MKEHVYEQNTTSLPSSRLRALFLGTVSVEVILGDDDRVGVPGLATVGSLKTSRVATVDGECLAKVGIGRCELDGKVVPA